MFNFLHTHEPKSILISLGPIEIYWYGLLIALGIAIGLIIVTKLATYYQISKETVTDLAFELIVGGIIGARLYHVLLEFNYYASYPLDIFKIWQGGLAIHGALIAGVLIIAFFAKRKKINTWLLTALIAPAIALAQAIGRWGNYFNQELFGKTTDAAWGIPIDIMYRPAESINLAYYHPAFLYESLGNFIIFLILIASHAYILKKEKNTTKYFQMITLSYLTLYSLLRFGMEFIRIDPAYIMLGLKFPQIVSILIILGSITFFTIKTLKKPSNIS